MDTYTILLVITLMITIPALFASRKTIKKMKKERNLSFTIMIAADYAIKGDHQNAVATLDSVYGDDYYRQADEGYTADIFLAKRIMKMCAPFVLKQAENILEQGTNDEIEGYVIKRLFFLRELDTGTRKNFYRALYQRTGLMIGGE